MNPELEAIMKRRRQLYSPARRPRGSTDEEGDDTARRQQRRGDGGPPLLPPGDMTTTTTTMPPPPPQPRTPTQDSKTTTTAAADNSIISSVPPPPPPPPLPKSPRTKQQQQAARKQQTLDSLRGVTSSSSSSSSSFDDEQSQSVSVSAKPTFSSEDVFEDLEDNDDDSSQDEILAARTSTTTTSLMSEQNHNTAASSQEGGTLEENVPQQSSAPLTASFQANFDNTAAETDQQNTTTTTFVSDKQQDDDEEEEAAYEPPPANLIMTDLKSSPRPATKEPTAVTNKHSQYSYYSPRNKQEEDPRPKQTILLQETDYFRGEPFLCPPVVNPLTNNVIACRRDNNTKNNVVLQEYDMRRSIITLSTNVLSAEVKHKISSVNQQQQSPYKVSSVLCCAAGLHRTDNNHTRVRVGVLVEFDVLGTSSTKQTALLIYQWGYGTHSAVHLQSLLPPPQSSSFTYSPDSLQLADGLVFLSGMAKNKGPCIFCVKPHIKDVWQVNLLDSGEPTTTTTRVSTMKVTTDYHRKQKYMAIALTDGSVSVYSYESAVERKAEQSKKTLLPLCRLECMEAIEKTDAAEEQVAQVDTDQDDYCTGLEWSRSSDLLLLGAAFSHGMVVFHVSLPLMMSTSDGPVTDPKLLQSLPAPTASTQLSNTVLLHPMTVARWSETFTLASLSWIHFGPHMPYGLAFLLEDEGSAASLVVGTLDIPTYSSDIDGKESIGFRMLCKKEIADVGERSPCRGIIAAPDSLMVACYDYNALRAFRLSLSSGDSYFTSMKHLVASASPGLDSAGNVSLPDAASDRDGILQVASVTQCKRTLAPQLSSPVDGAQLYSYSLPLIRHWLVRSFVGDSRDAQRPSAEDQSHDDFDGNVTGGSYSKVVCDLQVEAGHVPCRIVRCKGSELCAVLFRPTLGVADGPLTEPDLIALVDTNAGEIVEILDGRDIAILPKTETSEERLLILSPDGGTLFMVVRTKGTSEWTKGSLYRPVAGDADETIECHRLYLLSVSDSKMRLIVCGTRVRDGLACLVMGSPVPTTGEELNTYAIPDVKKDPTFWLSPGEELVGLHELPRYQDGNRCIAISTDKRVLLLSDKLVPVAEYNGKVSSASLASIGSHGIAFCSDDYKLRYLCCLEQNLACGTIASLPVPLSGQLSYHLLALRPERFVYTAIQNKSRLIELGQNENSLTVDNAMTRPAMLLEPMIANALCEADQPSESTNLLRAVIEKFGRKSAAFPHRDDEGIGTGGMGLTPRVFEIFSHYGLKHPASWLLTGTPDFQRSSNTTVLPSWIPVQSKSIGAMNADARLHVVTNGDSYLSDYVRSPDQNMASTLPRPTDPSARLCHEFAKQAMEEGDIAGALKLLDFSGSESSDGELLNVVLSLQLGSSADISKVLSAISGQDDNAARSASPSSSITSSLAALAKHLRSRRGEKVSDDFARQWLRQLAPSLRRSRTATRARHRLIGESALEDASWGMKQNLSRDRHWKTPCNESKHIWNEGPGKDKENLLLLDSIDDWLGRVKPGILGKEGASAALERGEKTLADILGRANDYEQDSFGDQSDEGSSSSKGGWVEGVGEGRTDEDNLSGYYRFSEGADEDSNWKTDGFEDLSNYQNRAIIVGAEDSITLEPSTSSVDEGDPGKVKLLYDLVFSNVDEAPFGLVLEVERGSSLDVGILHSQAHDNRRRSTLEFWFNLPPSKEVKDEIVLARRSTASGEDPSKLCKASEKGSFLWELVALPSGELEFRTNCGNSMLSSSDSNPEFDEKGTVDDFGDFHDDGEGTRGLVTWQRPEGGGGWNHVCVVFSSREHSKPTECTVKLYMRGARVAVSDVSITPPNLGDKELSSTNAIDEAMKRTALVFGLNAPKHFRMTELRVWSCERSEEDLKMMMYEYLHAAETKRQFKIKIRNKQAEPAGEGTTLLAPPKEARSRPEKGSKGLLLPPPRKGSSEDISPRSPQKKSPAFQFDAAFEKQPQPQQLTAQEAPSGPNVPKMSPRASKRQIETGNRPLSSSVPLSRQVRSSAAAALVRGPPATRHFGGNRGGLSDDSRKDFVESRRFGVGAIAICGAEKTVVYSCDQDPPGKTYPIGASGAIISDKMDNQGSEYLCCFLAKDKRMVVFELSSKTVVVELQMTTKLNFWRYLPPQAHGHTLVFMLITPIGGFHWLPLDESPRPRQVWKRGPELQGKKIVMYEEGGNNGLLGADARATVALLLVSSASSSALEAWVMQIGSESQTICVSGHVLGAALSRLFNVGYDPFLPFIVTANTLNESDVMLEIGPLIEDPSSGNLVVSEWISRAVLDQQQLANVDFAPPTLAMGTLPEVLCCCHENAIVVCVRRKGLVAVYNSELSLARQEHVGSYIVDVSLRSGDEGVVEVVLLLSDNDNPRDGRIVSFEVVPVVRVAI